MKKQVIFFLWFFVLFWGAEKISAANQTEPFPPVSSILKKVWANMKWQPISMSGVLRTKQERYLLNLKTQPYEMEYELVNKSPRFIRINLDSKGARVWTRATLYETWQELPSQKWKTPILQTDVAYEELTFDFLTWPKFKEVGVDSFKTLSTYVLDAFPEGKTSSYTKVRLWVSQQHYVVVRADAYNAAGQIVKRLEVNGVQNIGSVWFLKELQISTRMKDRDLAKSRTYLEIQKGQNLSQ